MDNTGREELLLEVIKDFTSITYPEYADDDNIKEKIYEYIYHLKKFKENPDEFTHKELTKLNKLHQFFYGVSFDPQNPNSTIYKTPIFDKFNLTYQKIDKLINETNDINADLLKSLLNIISVYYDPSKNKDAIINEYLDKVIIPVINKYKGIGVVADSSLKEEQITEVEKSNIKSKIGDIIKKDKDNSKPPKASSSVIEQNATGNTDDNKAIQELVSGQKTTTEAIKNLVTNTTEIRELITVSKSNSEQNIQTATDAKKTQGDNANSEQTDEDALKKKKETTQEYNTNSEQTHEDALKKTETTQEDNTKIRLMKLLKNKTLESSNTQDETDTDKFDINANDYDTLKEYLQALYLQLDIDKNKKDFINLIIKNINELKIINLENNEESSTKIEEEIKKHLNEKKFDINIFLKKYNDFFINNKEENNNIFKILLLFKVNKKGNYLTSYKLYSNNLKLLNKLFNYPNPEEINDDFYKNQLKFLIIKLTENNDNILDIIENIRLLINLIIERNKKIYDIKFSTQVKECKINDLPDTYNKILILLNLLLKNDDFNSNVNGNILTGGAGDEDKILSEKKINDINLNLLFNLIKDLKEDEKKDDIVKIYKLIIDDKNKKEDIENIIKNILKIETIDLKKTIITEFNKNINRIFKDEKGNDITEENIIKNLCDKTFNLETLINNKKLRELIKLKELAPGTNLFYYYYKYNLGKSIKKTKFIDNIEQLLSINDFCTIIYNMYPGTEVKFQDIIYIENSKYKLPIIYDDKRNDSYDIIELIFDILKNNDIDYKSKIKKLLLDFNNEFIINDNKIEDLKILKIDEQLFEKKRGDIVKEIKKNKIIETTNKCLDYMNNTIDFYKTEIARILSYNLPKFYEEKSSSQDVSFDIDTLFKDSNYVSDNIVKNNFLKLNLKDYKYNDKYYPIEKYITLKELYYFQKNVSPEIKYSFCNDENKTYNKEDFIKEIKNRIRNKNLNLTHYIDISYKIYDKYDKEKKFYYLKNYKCQIKDILTLKSNLSFNYLNSLEHNRIVYDLDIYYKSSNTTKNKDLNSSIEFYKYLYLYFLNEKIIKIKYSSIIYKHCKIVINDFITKKIENLELKKPIELEFFENIEEAKENLKDKLEKILNKSLNIDDEKSYEDIIFEVLKDNKNLLEYIDIKKFIPSFNNQNEKEQTALLNKKLIDNEYEYYFKINILNTSLFFIDVKEYLLKDFIKLKNDKIDNFNKLLQIIANKKLEKNIAIQKDFIKKIENENNETDIMLKESLKGYNEEIKIKPILNLYKLKINVENLKDEVKIKALEIYNLLKKNSNFKPIENEILGGSRETESYNTYIYKYIDKSLQTYLINILKTNKISVDPISLNIFKQLEEKKEEFIKDNDIDPKIKLGSYEYVINEHYKNVKSKGIFQFKKTFKLSIKKIDKDEKNNIIQENKISSKKFNLELLKDDKINVNVYENGLFNRIDFIQLANDNIDFSDLLKDIIKDPSYQKDVNLEIEKAKFDKEKAKFDKDEKIKKLLKIDKLNELKLEDLEITKLNEDVKNKASDIYDLLNNIPKYQIQFGNLIINEDIEDEEEENEIVGGGKYDEINKSYETTMYSYIIKSLINYLKDILKNKILEEPITLKYFKDLEKAKEKFIKENTNIIVNSGSYEYVIYKFYNDNNNIINFINIKKIETTLQHDIKVPNFLENELRKEKININYNIKLNYNESYKFIRDDNGIEFKLIDFIKLKSDDFDITNLLKEIIIETKEKDKKDKKDEKIKKLLKIDLLKQIEFKEFNKEVKDIASDIYELLNNIPKYQITFGNLIINEDIEEEEEEILGGGIYDEIDKSYETLMYSYIIKSLINYLYDILNSNKIPNKILSSKKYIPDTLIFFQKLEDAKIKIKNDKIDTKFSYEHCLKQYFKIYKNIKNFTFKKILNENDSYFIYKYDIIKDIFDNINLSIKINDIENYENLIDLIQFEDDIIFDMTFLKSKFKKDTDNKENIIKQENEKKENEKKENEKKGKKENIEDYEKLFNLEEFKEFKNNDYKGEIKNIAYDIYVLLNNIPKYKKKFDPNYNDKDKDDDINKSYESIIYNYIINSLINYLENILKENKKIPPPISLKIFQDLEKAKQKFILDKNPIINEGSYEYVIYNDYEINKKKIAIKSFNNKLKEKLILNNLELSKDKNIKISFSINKKLLNITIGNGEYKILDFIKTPDDTFNFYDLLKEIIDDDDKKKEYIIEDELDFKKLFNLDELKIYKNRTISKENKEKAIKVYKLLNNIPKYQIIFGNLFINKDIEDEEEENEILGGGIYYEIDKSYDTLMYKFIIKSLINYLKDLFRNFTIKIPFSLTFFKELEKAKKKFKRKFKRKFKEYKK